LNRSTLNADQWRAYAKGGRDGSTPAPTPPPARKSNDQIADEVLQGLWGNGDDRKAKLTAAGYVPAEIQQIVNQKLGGQPVKKSNDQIANEVVGGLWGNGDDRTNRLRAAGYDPAEIQRLVNIKVGVPPANTAQYFTVPSGPAGYLGNIAARFGTSVGQIVEWNKGKYPISANYVQAGWVIRVK